MKELPARKNIRLKDYDYSQPGCYFVTICVKDKQELLGKIDVGARIARPGDNAVVLSDTGTVVNRAIQNIRTVYPSVLVDKYVIMPNHIHLILSLNRKEGRLHRAGGGLHREGRGRAMRAPTISTIINQMKGYVTKQIGYSVWQKLFYDHMIHNENEYRKIWQYVEDNLVKWEEDCYYIEKTAMRD